MKNPLLITLLLVATFCDASIAEDAGAALAHASRCYSCHEASKTLIGPPYQAIAARYADDRETMATVLAQKIRRGGGGNWSVVPMVPNEHVNPADALMLARWILSQPSR